ncbi:MAG: MutS family DNA mismatch repair protein [Roseiflexaceae bacterium]
MQILTSSTMEPPPAPPAPTPDPAAVYQARCAAFGQERDRLQRRSSRNADLSLVLLLAGLACLGLAVWRGWNMLYPASGLLLVAFVVSFVHHGGVNRQLRRASERWGANDEGLRRLRRDWQTLPLRQPPGDPPDDPVATDLDLLGHASLQHLLNTVYTPVGQATLQGWLLRPAAPEEARERAAAAAELAPLIDFRDDLAVQGRLMGSAQANYERFLLWAGGAPWLAGRGWLLWLARLLALVNLALLAAHGFGLTQAPLWLISGLVSYALLWLVGRPINEIIEGLTARQSVFLTYAELFDLVGAQPLQAPRLRQLQHDLADGALSAGPQMHRLARLMPLADVRNALLFTPVRIALLWDIHVLWLLERWQRSAGPRARAWLTLLGEFEALAALATLAHDHPGWTWAGPASDGRLDAHQLGHPLLPPAACVRNDVVLGPPGSFLLVTGSNMSGKSTLLRAIGLNVALAQMGGPVCAAQLRLPPVTLATSMRVRDSLEQGVSYFMAELRRLKTVVAAAEQARAQGDRLLLFLLDEILQGTNTAERQIAARRIIRHLLHLGALGAVSTHDLDLAQTPELDSVSQKVYLTERFSRGPDGPQMQFDYQLRPGIATSTNALKLMELVGLPLEDEVAR